MKTINNYAQLVKAQHALNKSLAPVETDATDASQDYAIGEQFILDGNLCKAKTAIAEHDALVLNTNYEYADDLTTQIAAKQDPIIVDNVPTENSNNLVKSGGVFSAEANIYAVMGENGAKNLIPFTKDRMKALNTNGTWNGDTYTYNGVTFTVNEDDSITVSGTASGSISFNLATRGEKIFKPAIGSYKVTGCPEGGSASTYMLNTLYTTSAGTPETFGNDYGSGAIATVTAGMISANYSVGVYVYIYNGAVITTPVTFYPMIRLASDTDDTYQPYAKTNQQLTAENQTLTQNIGDLTQLTTTDKSSAVAAISEVDGNVDTLSTAVSNKHKVTIETVSTSGWTTDTTSQSGTTLYKKSISLNHVYVESPSVDIGASGGVGLPTAAEQTAYDLLEYATVDGTTLYLYASATPTTQFYIAVEGVD